MRDELFYALGWRPPGTRNVVRPTVFKLAHGYQSAYTVFALLMGPERQNNLKVSQGLLRHGWVFRNSGREKSPSEVFHKWKSNALFRRIEHEEIHWRSVAGRDAFDWLARP
jgi:hypothetical protein